MAESSKICMICGNKKSNVRFWDDPTKYVCQNHAGVLLAEARAKYKTSNPPLEPVLFKPQNLDPLLRKVFSINSLPLSFTERLQLVLNAITV